MKKKLEIIADTTDFYLEKDTAAAIGKFDGVHIGHRRLLEEILECKKEGLKACVFTFDPAPTVFFGQPDGRELTSREEKRILFERMGVDILIEFPLTLETAAMQPRDFVTKVLAEQMNVRLLAAGRDLSFGAKGAGDAALLQKMSRELGFRVKIIDKVCIDGQEVSSTLVRRQVEEGNLVLAKRFLGMPYLVAGEVVRGNQIGRTLGFPTVNLVPGPGKLLPPAGVYYSEVRLRGRRYRAITNVGCKPTVTDEGINTVETYLYDFDGDIYGETIEVYLHEFRRPEQRFESLEQLKRQLESDIRAGAEWQ
ncbi:MAG: bifunctional riboflavin kinase/FAD synthetase [Acetatifactor sp.]